MWESALDLTRKLWTREEQVLEISFLNHVSGACVVVEGSGAGAILSLAGQPDIRTYQRLSKKQFKIFHGCSWEHRYFRYVKHGQLQSRWSTIVYVLWRVSQNFWSFWSFCSRHSVSATFSFRKWIELEQCWKLSLYCFLWLSSRRFQKRWVTLCSLSFIFFTTASLKSPQLLFRIVASICARTTAIVEMSNNRGFYKKLQKIS